MLWFVLVILEGMGLEGWGEGRGGGSRLLLVEFFVGFCSALAPMDGWLTSPT